jgi:hypothetical protein
MIYWCHTARNDTEEHPMTVTATTANAFQITMLQDALDYHQNGDADDPACCTATAPCDTRIWVANRLAELSGNPEISLVADETPAPVRIPGQGAQTSGAGRVADPASDKQVALIQKLAAEKQTDGIGTFPARTLREILAGSEVSKDRASRLITVLLRQPAAEGAEVRPAGPAASDAQLGFLRTLAAENGEEVRTSYTKAEASAEITRLIAAREDRKAAGSAPVRTPGRVTEDGLYRTPDGEVYKVQFAVHGSGRLYAKKLTKLETPRELKKGTRTHEFVYEEGALAKLTPAMKMTVEQMAEMGRDPQSALYGTCCKCGLLLTDEESIAAGIGPICSDRV